jgi:hypothetical protein
MWRCVLTEQQIDIKGVEGGDADLLRIDNSLLHYLLPVPISSSTQYCLCQITYADDPFPAPQVTKIYDNHILPVPNHLSTLTHSLRRR